MIYGLSDFIEPGDHPRDVVIQNMMPEALHEFIRVKTHTRMPIRSLHIPVQFIHFRREFKDITVARWKRYGFESD
jgi:hypothetical protein